MCSEDPGPVFQELQEEKEGEVFGGRWKEVEGEQNIYINKEKVKGRAVWKGQKMVKESSLLLLTSLSV